MAQTYSINCFDGTDVWSIDLQAMEDNFEALRTHFSGVSQPANAIAGMTWYSTVKKVTKRRDSANNAWHGLMHGDVNTKIWMYKNTALEGWAIDAAVVDVVLALKGGSQAYNVNGGIQAGQWITSDAHTLTTAEIPAHDHGSAGAHTHTILLSPGAGSLTQALYTDEGDSRASESTSSGGSHSHTSVGSGSGHGHGISNFRPAAAVGTLQYLDL